MIAAALLLLTIGMADPGPSFDCDRAEGTVEELICDDAELAALDRALADVWATVMIRAADNADLPMIKAEQRGWIKGRNDCWKATDVRACVVDVYTRRIAELQATWRLVDHRRPAVYTCADDPANEFVATFFATEPPTVILERGDRAVVCYQERSASGARYTGPDIEFWIKGDEAMLTWGHEAETLVCRLRATP